jgi:fructose 1,6-bisphosphatase
MMLPDWCRGEENRRIHKLAWDTFVSGTAVARKLGLYGAGQDLLADAFSGNVITNTVGAEITGSTVHSTGSNIDLDAQSKSGILALTVGWLGPVR